MMMINLRRLLLTVVAAAAIALLSSSSTAVMALRGGAGGGRSGQQRRRLQAPAVITGMALIDADTDQAIMDLTDGAVIYLGGLSTANLNLQAVVTTEGGGGDGIIDKVQFDLDGVTNYKTEGVAPYALCGDSGGNYGACTELVGDATHTVTATAFSGGAPVSTMTVNFSTTTSVPTGPTPPPTDAPTAAPVVTTPVPTVPPIVTTPGPTAAPVMPTPNPPSDVKFVLVDANSNGDLMELSQSEVTMVPAFTFSPRPTGFNLRVEGVPGKTMTGVSFSNGQNEGVAPFAYCGDSGGDYGVCPDLIDGTFTVGATANMADGSTVAASVTFTIMLDGTPAPTISPAPTAAPTTAAPTVSPMPTMASCQVEFDGPWLNIKKFPFWTLEAQGAVIEHDLLTTGGFVNGIGEVTTKTMALDLRNPNANWREMDEFPLADGVTHGTFEVEGPIMYFCGGFLGGEPGNTDMDECFIFDHGAPAGWQWTALPSLPAGRGGGGMVYIRGEHALVHSLGAERPPDEEGGGTHDKPNTWKLDLNDLEAGWVEKANVPYLANHVSWVSAKDKSGSWRYYFFGGQNEDQGGEGNGNVADVYEWDESNPLGPWVKRASLPAGRGHTASSSKKYACGFLTSGGALNGGDKTSDVMYYDIMMDTWTSIGDLPKAANTPVCDVYRESSGDDYYYCTAGGFSVKRKLVATGVAPTTPPPTVAPTPSPTVSPTITPMPTMETPPLSLDGTWEIFNNQDFAGRHEACFTYANGKGYLMGGRESNDVDIFDPATLSWSKGAEAPMKLHHMQCVEIGGKIYLPAAWTGGYPKEDTVDVMWVYNAMEDKWESEAAMPVRRRRGSAAVIVDGTKLWVSHGNIGGHETNEPAESHAESYGWIDYYDTATRKWHMGDDEGFPDAPNPRDHTGGALVNGRICVTGGRNGGLKGWPAVLPTDCFDPETKSWSVEANIPDDRSGSAYGTSCDGKLLIAGGEGGISDRVDVFDGTNWETFANGLNQARHGTGLAVDCERNLIYIAGGSPNGGGGQTYTLEIYTP